MPPPVFRRVPFWEYGGLNPIRPFLGGRSDAARRVVLLPFALPVDAHVDANGGRCGIPRNGIPANADCRGGVFATRRFPRPPPIIRANHTRSPTVFIAAREERARRVG